MSDAEIGQIRVAEIKVAFKPDASLQWQAAEEEFVALRALAEPAKVSRRRRDTVSVGEGNEPLGATAAAAAERSVLAGSPEGRAFIERKLVDRIVAHARTHLQPKLQGNRPVVVEALVHGFIVPSAGLLGGTNMLLVVTTLRDQATGREPGRLDRGTATSTGNGLLGRGRRGEPLDPGRGSPAEDRLVANYIEQVEAWLLKR